MNPTRRSRGHQGAAAIVTGAGTGIGEAIAKRLAEDGARVIVSDKDEASAFAVCDAILASGHEAVACKADVCLSDDIDQLVALAKRRFGSIRILVNNAGIGAQKHFLETTADMFDDVMDINLRATFLCSKAAAACMAAGGGGVIVNIASHSGMFGSSGRAAYAASKGGVIALTRVMAVDLAQHRIRVNAIAPGAIDTPRIRVQINEDRRLAWLNAIPLARMGGVDEVAAAVAFLASEDSSYITGQTISVDGGFASTGLIVQNLDYRPEAPQ